MSIYDPLRQKLASERGQTIRLTFSEIESILGKRLPVSAYKFNSWWGNGKSPTLAHAQAKAWLLAGFQARVSLKSQIVEFRRT